MHTKLTDAEVAALPASLRNLYLETTVEPFHDLYAALGSDFFAGHAVYLEATTFFRPRGVILGWSHKRGSWMFMARPRKPDAPPVACWMNLADFVAMIRDRAGTLKSLWNHGGNVKVMK